ncbi:MAG: InlB B-repeat-containing protein [Bacillota bacterium]
MKKLFALALTLVMAMTLAACGEDLDDEQIDITLESDVEEAELTQDPTEVTEGMEVTVSASAVEGYDFVRWIDADSEEELSTDRDYTFTAEEAMTLEAVYEDTEDETYSLDLASNVSDVSFDVSEEGPYDEGDEIAIEAPDLDTYNFVRWINADTDEELSTDRAFTLLVEEDMNLEAVYEDTLTSDERTAQDVVDDASDDPESLDTLMSDFTSADGMTMTLDMAMTQELATNPDDPDSTDTEEVTYDMLVEFATEKVDDERITKLDLSMTMPGMEESTTMTVFMEEGEDATTYTMDAAMLINAIEQDFEGDVKDMFAIDSDYVEFTVPHDLEGSEMEVVYDQISDAIYSQISGDDTGDSEDPELDEDAMDALIENLEGVKDFMNFERLSSYDDFDLDMERDGNVAEGTFTLGGSSLKALVEDMVEDIYTSMEAADESGELDPYNEFTGTTEYNVAMAAIESIQIPVTMQYDAEADSMFIDMGMNTLVNNLSNIDESFDSIQDMTMEMTMDKSADLDGNIPEGKDLEVIAEELMKVLTVYETNSYLAGIAEDSDLSADTYTVSDLESEGAGHVLELPFIDPELSEVTIDDSDATFEISLYYAHDESAVFEDTPLSLSDIGNATSEQPTERDDITAITDLVDDSNFDLYSVTGSILSSMIEASQEEWSETMPEQE